MSVAFAWALAAILGSPHFNLGRSTIVAITAPVALLGRKMPIGVG